MESENGLIIPWERRESSIPNVVVFPLLSPSILPPTTVNPPEVQGSSTGKSCHMSTWTLQSIFPTLNKFTYCTKKEDLGSLGTTYFPRETFSNWILWKRSCEVKKKVQQKASATEPNTVTEPSRSATMQKKSAFEDLKSTLYENNYKKSNFTALINEPF